MQRDEIHPDVVTYSSLIFERFVLNDVAAGTHGTQRPKNLDVLGDVQSAPAKPTRRSATRRGSRARHVIDVAGGRT